MNAPRLVSCYFGSGAAGQWPRLARVLELSARRHCPEWQVDVRAIVPTRLSVPTLTAAYAQNTQKLEWWAQVIAAAPDGDRVALLDADTMVLASLDAVWEHPFDLAYTTRAEGHPFPINAGVIFVRVTEQSRAFMVSWRDENRRMLVDSQRHNTWRKKFGGINQAALGCLLPQADHLASLCALPCAEWNCEDSTWETFTPGATRIVHIKSHLRRAIFLGVAGSGSLARLVTLWREREREALADLRSPGRHQVMTARQEEAVQPSAQNGAPIAPPPIPTPRPHLQARPFPMRRRGRPRGPGTIATNVRIPQSTYDAYCRRATAADKPLATVLREALVSKAL